MRELKFRAWLSGEHGNFKFSYSKMEYDVYLSNKGWWLDVESGWDIQGEYETVPVMQSTGLKDKNGKDIYEGDIIRCNDRDSIFYSTDRTHWYYQIKWDEWRWNAFPIHTLSAEEFDMELRAYGGQIMWPNPNVLNNHWHYEVVGNRYETPELLNTEAP